MRKVRAIPAMRAVATVLAVALVVTACAREAPRTVVLIGGPGRAGAPQHDFAAGVAALRALVADDPALSGRLQVRAYPDGWPDDPAVLRDAATVVWYFEGEAAHPLRDPAKRRAFDAAVARGTGVVALHQSSTVPRGDDLGLKRVLGAVRVGLYDRSTEWTTLRHAASGSALLRAVPAEAGYRDEFYPTFVAATPDRRTPLLSATLHPQFRAGAPLLADVPEPATVAWSTDSGTGRRAFVYSGMHYAASFDQPAVRTLLRNAIAWTAGLEVPATPAPASRSAPAQAEDNGAAARSAAAVEGGAPRGQVAFHAGPQREGWWKSTPEPSAATLRAGFGETWQSPRFADHDGHPPRAYASPLFLPRVTLTDGPQRGETFDAVLAATSNGDVYLVNAARNGDIVPGRVLWHAKLGAPCLLQPAPLDGVPTGILSTPVVDRDAGVVYVTHCDPAMRWQAYALDLGSGHLRAGWPVRLDEPRLNAVNRNAGPRLLPPKRRHDFRVQRAALALSPDGRWLHVGFGETETGWLAAVDTRAPKIASAFATAAMPHRGAGGIWGSGGPAVDADGHVFVVTGSGYGGYTDATHDWTQSVLKLAIDEDGYRLAGTYTPFNHCATAAADVDLGSGGVALLPEFHGRALLAVGGKQGNVALVDRARMPGDLVRRPACDTPSHADGSLLPPGAQPQFGARGPLNVFGPYSDADGSMDIARSRAVPAAFVDGEGGLRVYVAGGTRPAIGDADSIPPSLVRLDVEGGAAAPHLRVAAREMATPLLNPGSPVVTSNGHRAPVVWVLDEHARRSAMLARDAPPRPRLHAFDGDTLQRLWSSADGVLQASGKYNAPAFGGGQVFVASDRLQAFGAGGRNDPVAPPVRPARAPVADAGDARAAAATPAGPVDAAALYRQRCASCHDHPFGNIPPRARLATYPRQRIVRALTEGIMQPQATGLGETEIHALADYLR